MQDFMKRKRSGIYRQKRLSHNGPAIMDLLLFKQTSEIKTCHLEGSFLLWYLNYLYGKRFLFLFTKCSSKIHKLLEKITQFGNILYTV